MVEAPARIEKHTRADGRVYTLPCNHSPLVLGFRVGTVAALLIGAIAAVSDAELSALGALTIATPGLLIVALADRGLQPAARYIARHPTPTLPVVLSLPLVSAALGALLGSMLAGLTSAALVLATWSALGALLVESAQLRIERRGFSLRTTRSGDAVRVAFDDISRVDRIALARSWQDITIERRDGTETANLGLDLNTEEATWLAALLHKHMAAWQSTMRPSPDAEATRSRPGPGSRSRS